MECDHEDGRSPEQNDRVNDNLIERLRSLSISLKLAMNMHEKDSNLPNEAKGEAREAHRLEQPLGQLGQLR